MTVEISVEAVLDVVLDELREAHKRLAYQKVAIELLQAQLALRPPDPPS